MKITLVTALALCLAGCARTRAATTAPPAPSLVGAASRRKLRRPAPAQTTAAHISDDSLLAENNPTPEQSSLPSDLSFSEAPMEPSTPSDTPLIDADACPTPLDGSTYQRASAYDDFMNRVLNVPPGPDSLLTIRVSPSFEPDRTLSLHRRSDGTYALRAVALTENVWAKMLTEMGRQQGAVIRLDDRFQDAALARVSTARVVAERKLDSKSATLFLELWRSLTARAQVVQEVGIHTAKLDGVVYRIWYRGKGIATHSPEPNSVLGKAVSSAERLYQFTTDSSTPPQLYLSVARGEMQDALDRTRRRASCLRPYEETEN